MSRKSSKPTMFGIAVMLLASKVNTTVSVLTSEDLSFELQAVKACHVGKSSAP